MKSSALIHLTILLVFCLLAFGVCFSQAKPQTVSPTITVGETVTIKSKFEGLPVVEPHMAAHPANAAHLLVAAMVVTDVDHPYQSSRLSSFVSMDGGRTWQETAHDYWGYDPWTAILPNGQTAMGWLGTKESFQHQFPIQFFSSPDGGQSWREDVQPVTSIHGHDGAKITAHGDDFYFTTVRFNDEMGADVIVYHRKDAGQFREVAMVNSQGVRLNFCEPAILTDGSVLVPSSHFLKKAWVQRFYPESGQMTDKSLITIRPGGNRGYMRLSSDIGAASPFANRTYFIRASDGIWLNYSSDLGQSWSKDIRVDRFNPALPSKALVPGIAINYKGIIGICWVDSQEKSASNKFDLYFTYSLDGGLNFQVPIRVTKNSTDPRTSQNGDVANKFPGGGHYLNLVAKADDRFQLVWSDSRSGLFELQTCEVVVSTGIK